MRNRLIPALLLSATVATPVYAQGASRAVEGRVDRLEGEMRAVQRKVFPGGTGQYVQPDTMPEPAPALLPGPSTSAVADLTTRVDSLESQLRGMLSQVETNQHRLQTLETRIKALEADAAAAPAPIGQPGAGTFDRPSSTRPSVDRPATDRTTPTRPVPARPATTSATDADPTRAARLAAVEKSDSGDVAEDTYLYGYRLWAAKLYPEAEAQFKTVTSKYPKHKRASYAQNLLGRSYFDDGKPSLASLAFYDSYKNWPDGDRAPESLYFLAQSLVKLDKPAAQVCKVYTELTRSYGAKVDADARMKAGVVKGKAASGCS